MSGNFRARGVGQGEIRGFAWTRLGPGENGMNLCIILTLGCLGSRHWAKNVGVFEIISRRGVEMGAKIVDQVVSMDDGRTPSGILLGDRFWGGSKRPAR